MKADRRNTTVVIALILSLTIGIRVLLWLAPAAAPTGYQAPALTAELGLHIRDVQISYAPVWHDAEDLAALQAGSDGYCVVYPDPEKDPEWRAGGPRVLVVVAGMNDDGTMALDDNRNLTNDQKMKLLAALGSLSRAAGAQPVHFSLRPDSDVLVSPGLPEAAKDLRDLLVRKQLIADGGGA